MHVTLQQLAYFVALADVRSFTGAADLLRVAQPTLSRQFKVLEDELGAPLVHRTRGAVTLTPAGDAVLREIGGIFTRSVRSYDWVGRYGGEEFLIVLPGSDFDSACLRAEELRLAVQAARIVDGETVLQVTSSFGVAFGVPSDHELEDVVRAVDNALYEAKRSGRNCVIASDLYVLAESPGDAGLV